MGALHHTPFLYRVGLAGRCGTVWEHGSWRAVSALFGYLDGIPDGECNLSMLAHHCVVPLTDEWFVYLKAHFPDAPTASRWQMIPRKTFMFPEARILPEGYEIRSFDEDAFRKHPFSHGKQYSSAQEMLETGSGGIAVLGNEIVASASSYVSMENEVELDVSCMEEHRRKGLAESCCRRMLEDCQKRGITVHWDAQNLMSKRMSEKFGFVLDEEYTVFGF